MCTIKDCGNNISMSYPPFSAFVYSSTLSSVSRYLKPKDELHQLLSVVSIVLVFSNGSSPSRISSGLPCKI